jgi:hypothetical protein
MQIDQAHALARRVQNTWRLTPPVTEWADALTPLDHDRAVATFTRLRDEHPNGLAIAQFVRTYDASIVNEERARARSALKPARPDCQLCDGTGYVDAPGPVLTVEGKPHPYTAVDRCPCRRPVTTATTPTDQPELELS